MAVQEALPTYMTMLNTLDGVRDETGAGRARAPKPAAGGWGCVGLLRGVQLGVSGSFTQPVVGTAVPGATAPSGRQHQLMTYGHGLLRP